MRLLYTLLLTLATPLILLRLMWRARKQPAYLRNVGERFGRYGQPPTRPVIWLHAVSVGETRAAEPLVKALEAAHPDDQILLTHMTPTGRETSEQLFGSRVLRCYVPYDMPWCTTRFLHHFRPRLGILMETELWPNLIHASDAAGVPLYLVNARMSERSARGYARLASLTRGALAGLTAIGAQTEADAQRLRSLGASQVLVTGNLKFDRGPQPQDLALGARLRALFGGMPMPVAAEGENSALATGSTPTSAHHPVASRHPAECAPQARDRDTPFSARQGPQESSATVSVGRRLVVLAASTREGEEELVLDAVAGLPEQALVVIVPRHPQRFDAVARLLQARGVRFQRRSEDSAVATETRVVLGDSMGELFAYYGACDIAFIGGSLLPLGGQNLLEACAVGKPVVIGPHTFNFAEATRLAVDAGAAIQVAGAAELGSVLAALLDDPARRARMGEAGRKLMLQHRGATARTLALLAFPPARA
jgi:3-deoxy-D-manno-octulosonic-acid transferase